MRFLSIFKSIESKEPPSPEFMARMNALIEKSMKSGELVATEGCLPSALGARIRSDKGTIVVTDGPFVETKEVIGGLAILEAASKEDAIRMVREFLAVVGDGECELRQIFTTSQPGTAPGDSRAQHQELKDQYAPRPANAQR
jgi:hypothetical protein